jgi:hypothetical protein
MQYDHTGDMTPEQKIGIAYLTGVFSLPRTQSADPLTDEGNHAAYKMRTMGQVQLNVQPESAVQRLEVLIQRASPQTPSVAHLVHNWYNAAPDRGLEASLPELCGIVGQVLKHEAEHASGTQLPAQEHRHVYTQLQQQLEK